MTSDLFLLKIKARDAVQVQLMDALDKCFDKAFASYIKSFQSFCEENPNTDKKFTYTIPFTVIMAPMGRDMVIAAKATYGMRKNKVNTAGQTVSLEPSLDLNPPPEPKRNAI